MAKNSDIKAPDYDKVRSIDQIDKNILECQRVISRKYKLRVQAESAKSDLAASYNEQIKHLKEELEHELGVLSGWENRKKVVSVNGAIEDEAPAAQEVAPQPVPTTLPATVTTIPSAPPPTSSVPLPPPPSMMAPIPPPAPPAPHSALPHSGALVPFPRKSSVA